MHIIFNTCYNMGVCYTSNTKVVGRQILIPATYYLSREKSCLLLIKGKSIEKHKLESTLELPVDSALVLSQDKIFFLAGGTSSLGLPTADFLTINPKEQSVSKLPDLPVAVKKGTLIMYENWIYHVGGVEEGEKVGPVMRFDTNLLQWESLGYLVNILYLSLIHI